MGAEEEPLCSDDDVSEEENQNELFDTDNVVVCLYDKVTEATSFNCTAFFSAFINNLLVSICPQITRSRNKWKFYLKDGIMNIGGKDYIFQKCNGDAEW